MIPSDLSIFPIKAHQASLNIFSSLNTEQWIKKTLKAHAPHENKAEHSMSHMVLSSSRKKEKGINCV